MADLPEKPITREEQYLAAIAGVETKYPEAPITRVEAYLDQIAKNGGGGSAFGVSSFNGRAGAVIPKSGDYETSQITGLPESLSTKQPTLTGSPGQLIGIGDDGTAKATVYQSNPNLLDNWYFLDPINQREFESTASMSGSIIDRWIVAPTAASIPDGSMTLGSDGLLISNGCNIFLQRLEKERIPPTAAKITLSLLVDVIKTGSIRFGVYASGWIDSPIVTPQLGKQIISNTISIKNFPESYTNFAVQGFFSANATLKLIAAKLELGPIQTLAHKEGDTWALNDPPPNKALELAKCQRYQLVLTSRDTDAVFGTGITVADGRARIFIPTPATLRAIPTISYTGSFQLYDYMSYAITNLTFNSFSENGVNLVAVSNGSFGASQPMTLRSNISTHDAKIIIDANL